VTCLPSLISFDQFSEVGSPSGLADPGVFEELFGTGSLLGLLAQTKVDKVFESLTEVTLELRRRVLGDEEKNFHRMNVGIRGLSVGELQGGDTKRPDVGFVVVSRLFDNLRSHPEWSSYKCVLLGHGGRQLTRNTKVG
jgi:hypothetical protein